MLCGVDYSLDCWKRKGFVSRVCVSSTWPCAKEEAHSVQHHFNLIAMTAGLVAVVLLVAAATTHSTHALARPTSAASDPGLFPGDLRDRADVREAAEGDAARFGAAAVGGAYTAAAAADKVLHLPGWGTPDVSLFSGWVIAYHGGGSTRPL